VLDVDVIFVGGHVVDEPGLHVPHPRWYARDFVVVPLLDVVPEWRDPRTGRTVADVAREAGWEAARFRRVAPAGAWLGPTSGSP
jgi:2-amino-4-hydroxy-6-hydroxymethyldihydropteridine diphosphokinase